MRTGPANPPAKTIGAPQEDKFTEADKRHDLQAAVTSILPGKNDGKNDGAPPATPVPVTSPEAVHLKPMRTYESDVAEVLSHTHASSASMAIAEKKRQEKDQIASLKAAEPKSPSHAGKKIFILFICLILIGGGAYAAYYLYSQSALAPIIQAPKPTATAPAEPRHEPALIPADSQVTITADTPNSLAVLARIQKEIATTQAPNTIKEIIPVHSVDGRIIRLTAPEMQKIMDVNAPDILVRSLAAPWMLGVYTDTDGSKSTFVVTTNNFFQNAFAGVLEWEKLMPDDLKQYLQTSTLRGVFQDRIIKNKDVREYVSADGHVLFLYSFVSNDKMVMAGSEAALTEILTRLEKQAFVR
jgi:hypothetical protein